MTLETRERQELLQLARMALIQRVTRGSVLEPSEELLERFSEPRGCFVTLEKNHQLRGCMGHIFPVEPLARGVVHNAGSAAVRDSRFSPVSAAELDEIEVEVSILSVPKPLDFDGAADLLRQLRPHVDGVVLELGARRSTFLPQVWEKLPDAERFLDRLSEKAGGASGDWRLGTASVLIYQVEAFNESQ